MADNVLVTGGAGYIGSVVVGELLQRGYGVIVLDSLVRGHRRAVSPGAELVVGNVGDADLLARLFTEKKIDAVMHFAAFLEVGESMRSPELYFRNNSANTLTLLEAVMKHGIQRFVFSATAALFGEPERSPIEVDAPLHPTNAYGESKLLTEKMLAWFHQIHGLRYASLRYFNAAGATPALGEDHRPETHLIPLTLEVALGKREHISIFGSDYPTPDGTCIRDYIHVLDLASAHILVLEALKTQGKLIYNLGNGNGFSVSQVVEAARRVTGKPIAAREVPRRAGDPAVLVASSARLQRELKWQAKYAEVETIIQTAWEWRLRHPEGYSE